MSNLVICPCWDVTTKEMEEVIRNGAPDIEWIKRHTGLATGSCQGRWCLTTAIAWLREHYPQYEWDKLTTARQPLYPTPAWKLAGATPEEDTA